MAMELDKKTFTLTAAIVLSMLFTGCASTLGVKQSSNDREGQQAEVNAKNNDEESSRKRGIVVVVQDAPLPRQEYDKVGNKIKYISSPNPYLNVDGAIPPDAKAKYSFADSLLGQGKLKQSKKEFRALTKKYPQLSGPWLKLGAILEEKDKMDDAIHMYEKAIDVNKYNVNAYIALGLAQRKQGYFSGVQDTYINALKVWKDFPEAHLNLAIFYDLYLNKPEAAQKHYEAYQFLTNNKDDKVRKWLVEVKRRTGIESSFIDLVPQDKSHRKTSKQSGVVANPEVNKKANAG
jgi:tetratricopeptide (TPR) repeat protein